jgi:hypothetical protein
MGKLLGLSLCHSTFLRNSLGAFQSYWFIAHEMVFSWMVDIADHLTPEVRSAIHALNTDLMVILGGMTSPGFRCSE